MGDRIYVVGGWCDKDEDDKTVEVYNHDRDEWTQVITLAYFFVDFGSDRVQAPSSSSVVKWSFMAPNLSLATGKRFTVNIKGIKLETFE